MRCFRLLAVVAILLSLSLIPVWGQRSRSGGMNTGAPAPEKAEIDTTQQRKQQKELQKKRYQDMKRDSEKLLEIATQLKQYVDKAGEQVLSLEVLHKAEEMEKLARQVKNNMKAE